MELDKILLDVYELYQEAKNGTEFSEGMFNLVKELMMRYGEPCEDCKHADVCLGTKAVVLAEMVLEMQQIKVEMN